MPEVIMPKMGDAMETGTLVAWRKKAGDEVKTGDVIAEIETDKSNVEIEAEDDGRFEPRIAEGAVVPVGGVIATIGEASVPSAPAPPAPAAPAPAPKVETSTWKPGPRPEGRVVASPLARRIAGERGVQLSDISGSGPNGRIIEADVLNHVPAAPTVAAQKTQSSSMRRVIAKRMVESKTTIPHFYVTAEVGMDEAIALRERLNALDEALPKISLNDMIVKACAMALMRHPGVNSAYQDGDVSTPSGAHVGIAVALDDGLIVPVVRDADKITLRKLAATSRDLVVKAREKKLLPQEYSGGTFTVSNLGGFDVEEFSAIIDPAQGAILAVATILKKAVVLPDDTIGIRSRLKVTLSGDHRLIDGAEGARFLQELKGVLQNPLRMLE